MINKRIDRSKDNRVMNDIIIATLLCLPLINDIIASCFKIEFGISAPLMGMFLIYSFLKNGFCISWFQFAITFIIIVFFLMSFVRYNINVHNIEYLKNFLYYGILPIIFVNNRHDGERILRIMSYIAIVAIITWLTKEVSIYEYGENMKYSNMLLPGGLAVMYQAFINKSNTKYVKALYIAVFILYINLMISWGTRGCLLAVVVYPLLIFLSGSRKERLVLFLLTATIGFFMIMKLENILLMLRDFLNGFGIDFIGLNRTITLLISDNLSNGRFDIWLLSKNMILNSGLLGMGISGFELITNNYTHNLFLQLLIEFGPLVGSIFILGIIYFIVKAVTMKNSEINKNFLILLLASSIIILQFSSTHWFFVSFWFFIYECYKLSKKLKATIVHRKLQ